MGGWRVEATKQKRVGREPAGPKLDGRLALIEPQCRNPPNFHLSSPDIGVRWGKQGTNLEALTPKARGVCI